MRRASEIVLGDGEFSLHDSKQAIGIVRDALETIAVVDSHRPPAQVEAELSQFVQVALDFIPQKRREDFRAAFVEDTQSGDVSFLLQDFDQAHATRRVLDDPVLFSKEILGVELWSKQREILGALWDVQ